MADNEQGNFKRGDRIADRYEVEKVLGTGMLGATYLVKNLASGKFLALKVLRANLIQAPRDRTRFEEAFNYAKAIRHDGLIRLGDSGEHGGQVFFTQEYFKSVTLRSLMDDYKKENKTFTLQEACQIVLKILDGIDHLNKKDIIHRNLKPENVLVAERRTGPGGKNIVRSIKITDYGMAGMINPTIFAESYINRAEARYLAAELGGFDQAGTPTSDIYSVGVMLYEMLVGQTPRGTYLSPTQLRGDLPEHIDDVVEISLAANAEDRYPTAMDMHNDISRSFSGDVYEERGTTSFRSILIGVGVAVLVIAAVGVYLQVTDRPDPQANAVAKDAQIRKQVQAKTHVPTEQELTTMVEKHPEMLYIPPGPMVMGRLHQESLTTASQSEPLAKTEEVGGFYIDRFEFPNRLKDVDGKPVRAVAKVTWGDADGTCQTLGKRMCSELEWEKACKGPANWIYSYGDTYDLDMCGQGVDDSYALGERESCVSGYGVWGLSGGPREWTASVAGSKGNRRVVKGGLRANNERGSRCAFAVDEAINYADATLSFRCCLDLDAPGTPTAPVEPAAPEGTPAVPEGTSAVPEQ